MSEHDIERALEKALADDEPRQQLEKTVVDHNVEHIQRLINELRSRESKLEEHITTQMRDLSMTRKTISIYIAALRGVS